MTEMTDFERAWFDGLGDSLRRRQDPEKPNPMPTFVEVREFEQMVDLVMDKNAPLYAALARDFYDE